MYSTTGLYRGRSARQALGRRHDGRNDGGARSRRAVPHGRAAGRRTARQQYAALSGDIEELRHVYEQNDLRPDLGALSKSDPVADWKRTSGDGKGLEVLAAVSLILEAGYVVLPLGRDLENNRLYIWPYFAEVPLDKLTPAQEVELLRLVPPAAAKAMRDRAKYTHWRVTIGADGSWHSFRKDD
jgi:hypothetical protein